MSYFFLSIFRIVFLFKLYIAITLAFMVLVNADLCTHDLAKLAEGIVDVLVIPFQRKETLHKDLRFNDLILIGLAFDLSKAERVGQRTTHLALDEWEAIVRENSLSYIWRLVIEMN